MKRSSESPNITELIFSFQTGGSERIGQEIARYLHSSGHDVTVCATHGGPGPVSELLEKEGIPWFQASSLGGDRFRKAICLFNYFRRIRCDILHVHHFNMLSVALAPARLAGVSRIVITEHSNFRLRTDPRTLRRARKYARRADAITVVHGGLERFVHERLDVGEVPVTVIPNGVDTQLYSPGPPDDSLALPHTGETRSPVRICSVGRLHPDKDHLNLLRAIARMRTAGTSEFVLYLVGEGAERESIEKYISEQALGEFVYLLGDRADVREILRNVDIFALSSRSEGLPVALLEAMSTGLPSVVTDVGGVADALKDGGGLVVPPKNPEALARAITQLVDDGGLRTRMGAAARGSAVSRFDRSIMFSCYEDLLLQAV